MGWVFWFCLCLYMVHISFRCSPQGHPFLPIGLVGYPTFILRRMLTLNYGSTSLSVQQGKAAYGIATPTVPHIGPSSGALSPSHSAVLWTLSGHWCMLGKIKKKTQPNNCTGLPERPHTAMKWKRMVEEREAGTDEVALALAASRLRCPEQPQHLSSADKKTSGISEKRDHWLQWVLDEQFWVQDN